MASHIVGYPRMGPKRELKFANESFWDGKSSAVDLENTAKDLRISIWKQMADAGITFIPSNTFSYYDQVLDTTALVGAVPPRYGWSGGDVGFDTNFSMARGNAKQPAMEMTKWFDTNYHYIVPELGPDVKFALSSRKVVQEYKEANEEPELLWVDAERIRRQMQEVAVGHYRSFINAAQAIQAISHEVASMDRHLESLITEIPKLTTGCNEFMSSAQQILEKRKLNQILLANHSPLLDLLEIPQLMDTCVRNGNYDDALDLQAFVSKLSTMHPRLPVIQSLVADVKQTTSSLLAQLLQRLRSNVQLPECLRLIGYLRRLGVYSEHEMRSQFLRCREAWLMGIINDLDQGNPYEYLKRLADCHRIHLFDVVTQYRAIFSDDTTDREKNCDGGLLYSWAMHRISSYLEILQDLLKKITEGVSLAIILEQCMYCGMSLGRVGLDFRGLLPPLFEESIHNLFVRNMAITIESFQHALHSHRWVPLPQSKITRRGSTGEESLDDVAPPQSLMEHPPLATFVNGILAALNELRHCAPINIKSRLASELQQTLQYVVDALLRHHATRTLRENETSQFLSMCRAFVEVVCPYCVLCFGRCYSGGSSLIQTKNIVESLRRLIGSNPYGSVENGNKIVRSSSRGFERNGLPSDVTTGNLTSSRLTPIPLETENGQVEVQNGGVPQTSS